LEACIESQLFDKLREIRVGKKISLEDIARDTRINIQFLEALENGDLLQIPRVYDKLFFKSYLKALGLTDTEYYDEFLAFRDQLRQEKTTIMIQDLSEEPSENASRFNYKYLFLMILPVLIAIVVIWFLVVNTESVVSDTNEKIEAIDIRQIVAETQSKLDSSTNKIKNEAQIIQGTGNLNLGVKATMQTWFRVVIDLTDTLEYTLPAGNTMNLKAQNSYQLLIGKADGLQLNLNTKDLGKLGNTGEVVQYIFIDSTGIVAQKNVVPKSRSGHTVGN
jgi:transcriptional regulator with XRE-family HTH domain